MSEFANVTAVREAKVFFNGKVTSRAIRFADGSVKTLGIMMPGKYAFSTEKPELMEIMSGQLNYRLKTTEDWIPVMGGQSFKIPGQSYFEINVIELVDYCCSYLD